MTPLFNKPLAIFARGKFAGETHFTAKGGNYKESITICNASDLFNFVLKKVVWEQMVLFCVWEWMVLFCVCQEQNPKQISALQAAGSAICLKKHCTHVVLVKEQRLHVETLFLHEVARPEC